MSLVTAMLVLGSVASTCYPLGYRLLVDGALRGSTAHVVDGVIMSAVARDRLAADIHSCDRGDALSDRIAIYRMSALIRLIGASGPGAPRTSRVPRSGRTLNANRRQLASAPRVVLSNTASVARIVTCSYYSGRYRRGCYSTGRAVPR